MTKAQLAAQRDNPHWVLIRTLRELFTEREDDDKVPTLVNALFQLVYAIEDGTEKIVKALDRMPG